MTTASNTSLVDIYNSMTAGVIPVAEGADVAASIRMLALEVLHAANVHVHYSIEDGFAYYIAVDSRSLASTPNFGTPLTAALPGHPEHRGDGGYYYSITPHAAAIVRRGTTLRLFVNFSEAVLDSIAAEGLERIEVTESSATPLQSQSWVARVLSNRIAATTSMACLCVCALSAVIFVGSSAVNGYLSGGSNGNQTRTVEQANKVIESASFVQPLSTQLNSIQRLSIATVRSGGWIEGYHFKRGAGEKFVLSMPSWVTQETVKTFGENVKTDAQPEGNLIWVSKKDDQNKGIKDKGPGQVPVMPLPPTVAAIAAAPSKAPTR